MFSILLGTDYAYRPYDQVKILIDFDKKYWQHSEENPICTCQGYPSLGHQEAKPPAILLACMSVCQYVPSHMTEILSTLTLFKNEINKMLMHFAIVQYNAMAGIISIRTKWHSALLAP